MQVANDIVRYFALTLQASPLYTLSTLSRQHVIIMQDDRMQRCLQKHHETRLVKKVPGNTKWMNEDHILPNGSTTRYMSYRSDKNIVRSLQRHCLGSSSIHEAWSSKGFSTNSYQLMQGNQIGIAFTSEKTRYPRNQRGRITKLDLCEEGKLIASVYIADDTRAAYDLAYRRIKAVQALRE